MITDYYDHLSCYHQYHPSSLFGQWDYNPMNNPDRPVQLPQKIQYLHQKIDFLHSQVKKSGLFELKMKFTEYIDTSIERIIQLDNKNTYHSQRLPKKHEEYYNAEQNLKERERLDREKQLVSSRLQELKQKQKTIQMQSLRIQLENNKILKYNIVQEANLKEQSLKEEIYELNKKVKSLQKQLEKLLKINSAQAREVETLKEERNRAEKSQLEWKQRYETEIGLLETYSEKKVKYLYRHQEGLRILRTVTNTTNQKKGCERYFLCDLPLKFHVVKIVYGIKVGTLLPNREIAYFKEVSLYEKQDMQIVNDGGLMLTYLKRKVTLPLKYPISNNQIIIMLFGKGDSIAIDQSQ